MPNIIDYKGTSEADYFKGRSAKISARQDGYRGKFADETWSPTPHVPEGCQGVTKRGVVCTSPPVKGQHLCVGHIRQAEKETR